MGQVANRTWTAIRARCGATARCESELCINVVSCAGARITAEPNCLSVWK
jgi:hypothetical protein